MIQRTPEWHAARLGWFTSSCMHILLESGRSKSELFSRTAMNYIYEVAAERALSDEFKEGSGLEMYIERMERTSKPMRWGEDFEDMAREAYTNKTGYEVKQIGFIRSSYFGDSPDGIVQSDEEGKKGAIEIKCPNGSNHRKYCCIGSQEELKEKYKDHYTQCQGHIRANFAAWCDFISFDPMQIKKIHIVRVYPDKEFLDLLEERLILANELVEEINKDLRIEKINHHVDK